MRVQCISLADATSSESTTPSLPLALAPLIEDLTRREESAVALEEDDDDLNVDEDGDRGVSLLVDHLANIAVVM